MQSKKILTGALIAFVGGVLFLAAFMASNALPAQDLTQYWTAAHLVAKNPYSMELSRQFEQSAGMYIAPLVTKIPPWAIMIVLPLGVLGYHTSFALWALMSIFVIAGCAHAIGHDLNSRTSLAPAVLPFIFGPTFVLLMLGQFTVLVLLGIVLFSIFAQKRQDWLAGAFLLLPFGKPHVVLLFLIAIVLWVVHSKRWIIVFSGVLTLASATLAAVLINHHIFVQFWERTLLVVHERESYPNVGGLLYSISGLHVLALLPQFAGLLWLVFYWRKHRFDWDWKKEGMVVLLVSVTCSYYSYPYDEILALPALLIAFASGNRRAFVFAFAITDLGYALYISNAAGHFGYGYMFLWWTALGWLATYLLAQTQLLERVRM